MSITSLTRSAVYGQNGMVSSDSPLAASVGLRVLQDGGTAFDAALAVAAVECVTIVPMCGLGGDSFILAYDANSDTVTNINSSGAAAAGAEAEYYRQQGLALMPIAGPHSVSVPGEAAAWEALHRKFGTLPFAELLAPAIRYAENGFPVPPRIARVFANSAELLGRFSATADIYLSNGRPPREGEMLANPDLAASIRQVAQGGADAFYRGHLADQMVAGLNGAGGLFTETDFNNHQAVVGDAISTDYRGHRVYQTRPPSQGFLLLEMLNIVGGHDLTSMTPNSADAIHLLVESKKIAYSDRNRLAGDPNFVDWPPDGLLSPEYSDLRRDQIHPFQAGTEVRPLTPVDGRGDTTYFCVADGRRQCRQLDPQPLQRLWFRGGGAGHWSSVQQPRRSRLHPRSRPPQCHRSRQAHHAHAELLPHHRGRRGGHRRWHTRRRLPAPVRHPDPDQTH